MDWTEFGGSCGEAESPGEEGMWFRHLMEGLCQ